MNQADLQEMLEFARRKTLDLLETVAKQPQAATILGWRPGPGRAHMAWQFMHLAATDDRHLHVRMRGGSPQRPDYVGRFAGGSVPDDDIPTIAGVRDYLSTSRGQMLEHLRQLGEDELESKPNAQAPWSYREWFKVLIWHEGHHQGQAHLTMNLFRASQDAEGGKAGQS